MAEEASYDITEMGMQYDRPNFQNEQDKRLWVRFYDKPWQNKAKTAEEGRPIFEPREYVEIRVPGDRDNIVARPATDMDRQRFPEHYKAWKDKQKNPQNGTPLIEWPLLTRSQVEELKYFNIFTVEQLADMPDGNMIFAGANTLRRAAVQFLEGSEGAVASQIAAELEEKDQRILVLEQRLAELEASLEEAEEPEE